MSWSFSFKGKREKVIEAVKAWKPTSPLPDVEVAQCESAKAVVLGEAERNPSEFVQVAASGSYWKSGDTGSSSVSASAGGIGDPTKEFLL